MQVKVNRQFAVAVLAVAALLLAACAPQARIDGEGNIDQRTTVQLTLPEWVTNLPDAVRSIFGIGSAIFESPQGQQTARNRAAAAARKQIADSLQTQIQAMTKSFVEQVVAKGEVAEVSISTDVLVSVTNRTVSGAEVRKTHVTEPDANGRRMVFVLCELNFDKLPEVIYELARSQVHDLPDFDSVEKQLRGVLDDYKRKAESGSMPPQPAANGEATSKPSNEWYDEANSDEWAVAAPRRRYPRNPDVGVNGEDMGEEIGTDGEELLVAGPAGGTMPETSPDYDTVRQWQQGSDPRYPRNEYLIGYAGGTKYSITKQQAAWLAVESIRESVHKKYVAMQQEFGKEILARDVKLNLDDARPRGEMSDVYAMLEAASYEDIRQIGENYHVLMAISKGEAFDAAKSRAAEALNLYEQQVGVARSLQSSGRQSAAMDAFALALGYLQETLVYGELMRVLNPTAQVPEPSVTFDAMLSMLTRVAVDNSVAVKLSITFMLRGNPTPFGSTTQESRLMGQLAGDDPAAGGIAVRRSEALREMDYAEAASLVGAALQRLLDQPAGYYLVGTYVCEPHSRVGSRHVFRGRANVELRNANTGDVLDTFSEEILGEPSPMDRTAAADAASRLTDRLAAWVAGKLR